MHPNTITTHQNMSLGSNVVDWMRSLQNIPVWLRGTSFYINCTSSPRFAPSFMQWRNDPKCIRTLCNALKHEFRVQWGGLGAFVEKILTWLLGKNFRINCTSSPCFASSLRQLWNDPKCTQTLCDAPKHEFRVQWGGLSAFVAKTPDLNLWHELLY